MTLSTAPRNGRVPIARSRVLARRPRRESTAYEADLDSLRVAIVCDWLLDVGGAERVILQFHEMFPHAPILTSQYNPSFDWFKGAQVHATRLQHLPFGAKKFIAPLRAAAFRLLDLSEYDLILASSSAEAKSVRTRPDALQVTYCHSPIRYYWASYDSFLESPGLGRLDPIGRFGLKALISPMRSLDYRAAQQAGVLVANSTHIQNEISKHYRLPSELVHPPVDIDRFAKHSRDAGGRRGFVIAGRQTHYKRFDLAVEACSRLGVPLTVVGNGPEHANLRRAAGPSIEFVPKVDDAEMPEILSQAEAFLCPGVEDFGITPVEAMATGTPVIAYRGGGAEDYVRPGVTGLFFDVQTTDALISALHDFSGVEVDHERIRLEAARFGPETFRSNMRELILSQLARRSSSY